MPQVFIALLHHSIYYENIYYVCYDSHSSIWMVKILLKLAQRKARIKRGNQLSACTLLSEIYVPHLFITCKIVLR